MAPQFKSFEIGTGLSVPSSVGDFFQRFGGGEISSIEVKLLSLSESRRLVDNWPRYGFSSGRGYVHIAEDKNGDLFWVACAGDWSGQVFHLAWAGEEALGFTDLEGFLKALSLDPLQGIQF